MMFFRLMLFVAGLLLYLVVRELFREDGTTAPVQSVLQPVPPPQQSDTTVASPAPAFPVEMTSTRLPEARADGQIR